VLQSRIRDLFRIIDAREWSLLRTVLHPDVVYARPGYPPFVGVDRVLQFYEHERVVASGSHLLTTLVASDGAAACAGRFVGTHRNGSSIDEEFADVYRFDGPLIVHRQSYFFRPAI
jgi:ketosteroid isomerase-like protein